MIAAETAIATAEVDALKAAAEVLAVTLMLGGTEAEGEALARATVVPPAGAGPDSVIVQVLAAPPVTVAGVQFIDESVGD